MGNQKLRGKDLNSILFNSDKSKSIALGIMSKYFKHSSKQDKLDMLNAIVHNPQIYLEDPVLSRLAQEFVVNDQVVDTREVELLDEPKPFNVFGRKYITSNAYQQMVFAMKLPIAIKGALMPDAHQGYGLPIGSVLATSNSVIPYGVGMDIGCRMSLSIFDQGMEFLNRYSYQIKSALKVRTSFGTGGELSINQEHNVLDRKEFSATKLLKQLHGKAYRQLGTSGSGNHFVEFGKVTLIEGNEFQLPAGEYTGLLSHSGSRGLGASVAKHYTEIAKDTCLLPSNARHMAWLDLDSEAGQEYWLSMNLAGDYAKACHDQIHHNLSKYLGLEAIAKVENHHNFAWKESSQLGEELVVHRKGATPAAKGELGIIPGSMASDGYIVRGKGEEAGLFSASHGAGRKMSRKKARNSYTGSELKKVLKSEGITLIGGGVDEAPIAYKNLEEVMNSQQKLVEIIGKFTPKIVRMDKN